MAMKVNIGITDSNRKAVAAILNSILADEHVLYTKTRNYHWNLTGPHFNHLHKFFEEQYEQLAESIDEIAERVRMVGYTALGTMAEFTKQSRLSEEPGEIPDAMIMVTKLLSDHESIIRQLREDIDVAEKSEDAGTSDFLTALMEQHEKMAWMLRATAS